MAAIVRSPLLHVVAAAVLLLAVAWPSTVQGQSCVSSLSICAGYLNSTKPSTQCCAAINETVNTQLACLCALLDNKELLKTFNLSQALELPKHCGIPGNVTLCNKTSAPSPPGSSSGGSTTPGTPPPKETNAAFAVTWIGTYGLMVLLALSWSIIA